MCATPSTVLCFETLHMFRSRSENVHVVWILSSDNYLLFFGVWRYYCQREYIVGTLCAQLSFTGAFVIV